MNLDATIKQLRREIEQIQGTLSVLENLRHKQREAERKQSLRRKKAAARKKPKGPA